MVLAVARGVEALGPRVPVVPVEGAGEGEVRVRGAGVGVVADQEVDPGLVGPLRQPVWVEVGDDGGGVDKVAVVEVVVVIPSRK